MKKIFSSLNLPDEVVQRFEAKFGGKLVLEHPEAGKPFAREELPQKLAESNGFFGGMLNKDLIDAATNLEIACSLGAGYDGFDVKYAGEKGIYVMNAPHATTEPTSELAITLMLCVSRKIVNFNQFMKEKGAAAGTSFFIQDPFATAPAPTPVHGKTLGIVGLGKIGKAVAKKAQGLGMGIIYYDTFRASTDTEKELNVKYVEFDELLRTSDYVTLHCLYTAENHHMMGAAQFEMMKPTAYFINAARGKLVNEQELVDALKAGKILGAALDVYEFEPKVTPELLEMDNVLLTPHIGTSTFESRAGIAHEALDGMGLYLTGGECPTIVNKEFYVPRVNPV